MSAALALDVYGLPVDVLGDWAEVLDDLRADLWWFRRERPPGSGLRLTVQRREPDLDRHGALDAAFVTPRNVVYQGTEVTVVEYFGRAVLTVDRRTGNATVEGIDAALVREAASNFLLSRIGEHLNRRGLVRLHAVGLTGTDGAVAVAMPSGTGKSTLALQALEEDGCTLLSEDSPLIDRHGVAHPFPLRIGVNPTDADRLPVGREPRLLERIEFHPKLVLDVETFADRVASRPAQLRHLVIGRRTLAREGRLEPAPKRAALGPLVRDAVVGIGVYQGMEFVLQRGWRDVPSKSGTAARRARCAAAALRGANVWRLWLGRDRESNWEAVRSLLAGDKR